MKTISLVCPNCKAQLTLNREHKKVFCNYCGAKFLFDDGVVRTEHTYTNSAELKRAEAEKITAETNAKIAIEKFKTRRILIISGIIAAFLVVFLFKDPFMEYVSSYKEAHRIVYITVPASTEAYRKYDNYLEVVTELENLGFTNVIATKGEYEVPFLNVMAKQGEVVDVVVNGSPLSGGKQYPENARIVVTYYSE